MSVGKKSVRSNRPFVSVSIDAAPASPISSVRATHSPRLTDAKNSLFNELLACCNRHVVPAAWAMDDHAISAGLYSLISSPVRHEVALLADPVLSKANISRAEILDHVARPLQLAATRGMHISTLIVSQTWQPRHIDLLTKYGVNVVRTPHVFSSHTTTGIRAICYGLWQVPISATLQGGGWVTNLSQWRFARRTLERAMLHGGWCHLRIDAASLAAGDVTCGLRTVDRLLGHLHQLEIAGHIKLETLRAAAARLAPKRSAVAAQSILRAA